MTPVEDLGPVVDFEDLSEIVCESGVIDCAGGPVQSLSVAQVRDIIDRVATLGFTLRAQHGTLDVPTDAFITGPNRYALERDGEIVHTSEFGLGDVYCDPTGPDGARRDRGHHVYVDMGLSAMLDTPLDASVHIAEIGERWAISPFRASTPELADWLGDQERPFTEALAVHVERPRRRGPNAEHVVGGPVVIAPHATPPERWPELGWHHRGERTPLQPTRRRPGYPTGSDMFVPLRINDVIDQWRVRRLRGVRRGYVGLVPQPDTDALTRIVLIGKEGDELLERQRGTTTTDSAVVVYDAGVPIDPTWERIPTILGLLGPEEVAKRFPDIPERTRRYLTAGRPPILATRSRVIEHLRLDAAHALAHAHRNIPDDLIALFAVYAQLLDTHASAARRCGVCREPLTHRQAAWCSDKCRQRARRETAYSTLVDYLGRPEVLASTERMRDAIAKVAAELGWPRVRRVVVNVLGHARGGRRGGWQYEIDGESGPRIVNELRSIVASDADAGGNMRRSEELQLDVQ